ncbi:MAG: rhodanese-like domain-containing protein [Gemmatimonadetes bacterium]|nr:rhodanese-like domain-containing protein [Gemmatimonadota bacterium]MDE3258018.1 rhodanese-like domain-containing protein [Gemmatimonadota bacterium]
MKSRDDLLSEARGVIPEMSVQEVHNHLESGASPVLLDVREMDEWESGHLRGAVHIPRGRLEAEAESSIPDKSREVVVYCAGGVRSLLAADALKELGYVRLISMAGGYEDWADAGLPSEQPPTPEEADHLDRPELLEAEIEHLENRITRKKQQLKRSKQ